jgi:hypothetical protein
MLNLCCGTVWDAIEEVYNIFASGHCTCFFVEILSINLHFCLLPNIFKGKKFPVYSGRLPRAGRK